MIVRMILSDAQGRELARSDELISQGGALPETKVSAADGVMRNEGEYAAVSAELILLPGEEAEQEAVEWLNA